MLLVRHQHPCGQRLCPFPLFPLQLFFVLFSTIPFRPLRMHQVSEQDVSRYSPKAHSDASYQRTCVEVIVDVIGYNHCSQPDDECYQISPFLVFIHLSLFASVLGISTMNCYLYSAHGLISRSSGDIVQKALMKALASRALVISGMFRSIAARRIL